MNDSVSITNNMNTKYDNIKMVCDGNILTCKHNVEIGLLCLLCKKTTICKHYKLRKNCYQCGKKLCIHNKDRYYCRECGGKSFCEHNKQRKRCKLCGGALICEHGKERNKCRECGGKSFCEHNRRRTVCKECKGGSLCEHLLIKRECRICHVKLNKEIMENMRLNMEYIEMEVKVVENERELREGDDWIKEFYE